jgi:hypothetical protein
MAYIDRGQRHLREMVNKIVEEEHWRRTLKQNVSRDILNLFLLVAFSFQGKHTDAGAMHKGVPMRYVAIMTLGHGHSVMSYWDSDGGTRVSTLSVWKDDWVPDLTEALFYKTKAKAKVKSTSKQWRGLAMHSNEHLTYAWNAHSIVSNVI